MAGWRDERKARARYLMGLLLAEECAYELAEALLLSALDYMPELAAARVVLGVVYCGLEREEEMLEEFREAIRLDVRAVRAAVREEPKELEELGRILYPRRETTTPPERERSPAVPAYLADLDESAALLQFGRGEMAAGRSGHAVELIERALRLDHTSNDAIAMLSLAYLLTREGGGKALEGNVGSVLWEVLPKLAEMLFKEERVGNQSHTNGQG
jgi:tetratricopeptide (TPR) repeat protein